MSENKEENKKQDSEGCLSMIFLVPVALYLLVLAFFSDFYPNFNGFIRGKNGERYAISKIGDQYWMAENIEEQTPGASCDSRGCLYTWASAMDLPFHSNGKESYELTNLFHRGLCPKNWHVPSSDDYEKLITYIKLKEWNSIKSLEYYTTLFINSMVSHEASSKIDYYKDFFTDLWTSDEIDERNSVAMTLSAQGYDFVQVPKYQRKFLRCVQDPQ